MMHSRTYFDPNVAFFCYIGDTEQRAWVTDPANSRRSANVALTLTHRLCRWSNIRATMWVNVLCILGYAERVVKIHLVINSG